MKDSGVVLAGEWLVPRPSGALHWPTRRLLAIGDLHLGRSERTAREGGALLPPYESLDTLARLEAEVEALKPRIVICLGDSFDDLGAAEGLAEEVRARIERLAAGRRWIWVAGNHDPGPVELPGTHLAEVGLGPVAFRHIAEAERPPGPGEGEVSAHFHPRASLSRRGQRMRRRCFLADEQRVILPAFGTYTGGLDARHPAFDALLSAGARAYLIGRDRVTALGRSALA